MRSTLHLARYMGIETNLDVSIIEDVVLHLARYMGIET